MRLPLLASYGLALGSLALLASSALAADPSSQDPAAELARLKATIQTQQIEIHQLQAQQGESWLNPSRADEVKALMKEVLADADGRGSNNEGNRR